MKAVQAVPARAWPTHSWIGALLMFAVSGGALAATTTTTFEVSATVSDSCSVSATNLAFGTVTPADNTNVDQTSTVSVTCSLNTAYNVGLNQGANSSDSTVTTRRMADTLATNFLSYQMYSDSGRTTVWGQTVGTNTVAGTGTGLQQDLTVFGRIPAGQQTTAVGGYSDTVTVTVTF